MRECAIFRTRKLLWAGWQLCSNYENIAFMAWRLLLKFLSSEYFFLWFLLKSSFLFQFMENLWRTFDLLYSRLYSKFLTTFWPCCCFFELRKAHLTAFCIRALDIHHLFHLKTNGHSVHYAEIVLYQQRYYQVSRMMHSIADHLSFNEALGFVRKLCPPVAILSFLLRLGSRGKPIKKVGHRKDHRHNKNLKLSIFLDAH